MRQDENSGTGSGGPTAREQRAAGTFPAAGPFDGKTRIGAALRDHAKQSLYGLSVPAECFDRNPLPQLRYVIVEPS